MSVFQSDFTTKIVYAFDDPLMPAFSVSLPATAEAAVVLVAATEVAVAGSGGGISRWKSLVPQIPVTAETSPRPPALQ